MKVLVVGGGGREHALGWALARSGAEVSAAPGNPGLEEIGATHHGVAATDVDAIVALAAGQDLVVVGPEAPLAAGLVDALDEAGITAFGPNRAGARLESSKAFAKEVMAAAGVATAAAAVFADRALALDYLEAAPGPFVVKADGLAAGKGVLVSDSRSAAAAWVDACFDGRFAAAGATVLIEEYLEGPELSVMAVCDGAEVVPLQPARDYKRLGDGDTGPNTGGMGAYSPVDLPAGLVSDVVESVMRPVVAELAARDRPYRGFLYAGLVLTAEGPKVLEFNCRLGDPEAQVILPRLRTDLAQLLAAAARSELGGARLEWSPETVVDVVIAAPGYPESPLTGLVIGGVEDAGTVPGVSLFHAGTRRDPAGRLRTAGGRVLNVVAMADDLAGARERAYRAAAMIEFPGSQYRSDIGSERDDKEVGR